MALNITTDKQLNLWGKQADGGTALEPQRNDLYLVDFKNALEFISLVTGSTFAPMLPQYVRSCTLPDLRTKAEPIRRDSVPYNMPSWDEPLDAVKIVFLLDTQAQSNRSDVIYFLDAWLALSRAGRGSRAFGYYRQAGWLELNSDYSIDFRFNINLYLLRGATASLAAQGFLTTGADKTFQATQIQARSLTTSQAASQLQSGSVGANNFVAGYSYQQNAITQTLVLHSNYLLRNAWLGGYKMSDLSYLENGLVQVEATFYIESFDIDGFENILS